MLGGKVCRCLVGLVVVIVALLGSRPAAGADLDALDETIARALRLLPRQPDKVVVLDTYPRQRVLNEEVPHVEAFVTRGERVVYLMGQGATLQHALKGPGIFDYALAAVIWHEMAHIDGSGEANAQREEERLWMEFIVARRVDSVQGLHYLALLKKRR